MVGRWGKGSFFMLCFVQPLYLAMSMEEWNPKGEASNEWAHEMDSIFGSKFHPDNWKPPPSMFPSSSSEGIGRIEMQDPQLAKTTGSSHEHMEGIELQGTQHYPIPSTPPKRIEGIDIQVNPGARRKQIREIDEKLHNKYWKIPNKWNTKIGEQWLSYLRGKRLSSKGFMNMWLIRADIFEIPPFASPELPLLGLIRYLYNVEAEESLKNHIDLFFQRLGKLDLSHANLKDEEHSRIVDMQDGLIFDFVATLAKITDIFWLKNNPESFLKNIRNHVLEHIDEFEKKLVPQELSELVELAGQDDGPSAIMEKAAQNPVVVLKLISHDPEALLNLQAQDDSIILRLLDAHYPTVLQELVEKHRLIIKKLAPDDPTFVKKLEAQYHFSFKEPVANEPLVLGKFSYADMSVIMKLLVEHFPKVKNLAAYEKVRLNELVLKDRSDIKEIFESLRYRLKTKPKDPALELQHSKPIPRALERLPTRNFESIV